MADTVVIRSCNGKTADDREPTVTDRQSLSSCSSQETVLGAGDERNCRQDGGLMQSGNGYGNNDSDTSSRSERVNGKTDDDGEDIFYDEQPQMALMSPLVTRWRRAHQGSGGNKVDSGNNNVSSPLIGGQPSSQYASGNHGANSSGVGATSVSGQACPPINNLAFDGYATLRNRKSTSNKPASSTSGNFNGGNDLTVLDGNGGMPRFPTTRSENRYPLSSSSSSSSTTTHSSVNRKVVLDEVDTKALLKLNQPWRRVSNYGSDGEQKSTSSRSKVVVSPEKKLGALAQSAVGNGNCVRNGSGTGGTAPWSPVATTKANDVDVSSKQRKPVVGKLSLFDRLPAFMLQSHQAKQQQQSANNSPSSPSATTLAFVGSSPRLSSTNTPSSAPATHRSTDVRRPVQLTPIITPKREVTSTRQFSNSATASAGMGASVVGIQPPKFDDTDEEALSPMVTSTCSLSSSSLSGSLLDATGARPCSSPVFESSPLTLGRPGARSPSSDRPSYAGLLPFPVASDSISSTSRHSSSTDVCNGRRIGESPRSTISSYEITDEQNNAAEIRRLRKDLKWAREQVQLFTSRLSTNTSVIEAFDQSLCNMAYRLQRIANSNLLDTGELGELHATICTLRRQNWGLLPADRGPIDMTLTPPLPSPPRTPVSLIHEPWQQQQQPQPQHQYQQQTNGVHGAGSTQGVARAGARDILRRQTSSESVASVTSASSAVSSLSVQTTCGVEPANQKPRTVKNWLRSSFGKAFSRRKAPRDSSLGRTSASSAASIVSGDSSVRADGAPVYMGSMPTIADTTVLYNGHRRISAGDRQGSASTIGGPELSYHMPPYPEMAGRASGQQMVAPSFVRGSDTRSSTTSIMSLPSRTITGPMSTSKPVSDILASDDELLFDGRRAVASHKRSESVGQTIPSLRFTSTDAMRSSREGPALLSEVPPLISGGHRLAVSVLIRSPGGTDVAKPNAGCSQTKELVIGSVTVNCSTTWLQLDRLVRRTFQDYLIRLDPATSIGLSGESVHCYRVGEVIRKKESDQPELLPIGYVVGDVSNIVITLKGSAENAVDRLAFELLVPKLILQRYVSLLVEHRRVILSGSTGTGKTFLAQRLAEFVVETCGVEATPDTVALFQVDNQSSRELRHYLTNIAGQCTAVADSTTSTTAHDNDDGDDDVLGGRRRSPLTTATLPRVVILDNLHRVTSLSDVFNGFLSVPYQCCPYVIGTMNQTSSCSAADLQMHHNFRWVLYANHIEPVRSFLGRYLRRLHLSSATIAKLTSSHARNIVGLKDHHSQQQQPASVTACAGHGGDAAGGIGDVGRVVEWLPKVWQRINQFLEAHTSCDITIGPRLFLSCPMDFDQAEVWFTDLWNYSIVPYLLEAVREGIQAHGCRSQWEELAEWVTETYPWRARGPSSHLSHHRKPHQQLHHSPSSDSVSHHSSLRPSAGTGNASCSAMLSLPLLRLQLEDVGYGGGVTSSGNGCHVTKKGTFATTTTLQPPPEMCDDLAADDIEELDPLTDMLARLQEAALRYSDHDSDGSESVTAAAT